MKPGKYDLSMTEYHAKPALGSSGIKNILRSPAHYLANRDTKTKPTPAMALGTAAHAAILEPHKFAKRYAEGPDADKRTKIWKEAVSDYPHHILLKPSEMAAIKGMHDAVYADPDAAQLLAKGIAEQSVFWEQDGVMCKCRPDWLTPSNEIVDLKTTDDAREEAFMKTAWNLGYQISAAHYRRGVLGDYHKPGLFLFLVVERDAPHGVAIYQPSPEMLEYGKAQVLAALGIAQSCAKFENFPAYEAGIKTLELPPWVRA